MNKGVNAALTERIEMVRAVVTPFFVIKAEHRTFRQAQYYYAVKAGRINCLCRRMRWKKGIDGRKGGSRTSGPVKGAVRKHRSGIFPEASQLFRCADAALYEAKRMGKNCSVIRAALSKCESGWHSVYSKRVSVKGRR